MDDIGWKLLKNVWKTFPMTNSTDTYACIAGPSGNVVGEDR